MRSLHTTLKRHWSIRPLLFCACAFLIGLIAISKKDRIHSISFVMVLGAVMLPAAVMILLSAFRRSSAIVTILLFFFLGSGRYALETYIRPIVEPVFDCEFVGTVVNDPYMNPAGDRLICNIRLDSVDGRDNNAVVRLYLRSDELPLEGICFGDRVLCIGHVWPADAATNPYQYDNRKALLARDILGMAAAKLENTQVLKENAAGWLYQARHGIITKLGERIDLLFPKHNGIVRSLILGDRSTLDSEIREVFRSSGIIHLICISGMHISILALAVEWLLSRFLSRRLSRLFTFISLIIYGFVIGFPVSFLRAFIMYSVNSASFLTGRASDALTRLAASLMIILIIKPYDIHSAGFVLSFLSSAGILLFSPVISGLFRLPRLEDRERRATRRIQKLGLRFARYMLGVLSVTLAVQMTVFPAIICLFGGQRIISVLTNLIAIPLTTVAYPAALFSVAVSAVWFRLGSVFSMISEMLLSAVTASAEGLNSLSSVAVSTPRYPLVLLLLHALTIVLSSGLSRLSDRKKAFLPFALIIISFLSVGWAVVSAIPFQAVFLDAGQADAALVKVDGKVMAFDIGDVYTPLDDYISASCVSLDAVFLTHPHYDHAGALRQLIETRSPSVIYVPEGWFRVEYIDVIQEGIDLALEKGIPIIELRAGDRIAISQSTEVNVYAPAAFTEDVNDLSMLLELRSHGRSILFTGDLTQKAEPAIIPDVDILKVAHHGSKKGTSDALLEMATPNIAIISVGENNYGHPSDDVIERILASGSALYRTDESGAITIWVRPDGQMDTYTYISN